MNSDPITPVLRTDFNVIDCYKTIIQTFTDWSQWSPQTLSQGLFDSCQGSVSAKALLYQLFIYSGLRTDDISAWPIGFDTSGSTPVINAGWCFPMPFYVS